MSLLLDSMEDCMMLDKTTEPDGYGGIRTMWAQGAEFKAAVVFDTSIEARIGAAQGVTSRYTITTTKAVNLQYKDHFKRLRDGKYFEVTSDGDDKATPKMAGLDMRQVTASEWSIPNG